MSERQRERGKGREVDKKVGLNCMFNVETGKKVGEREREGTLSL